MNPDQKAKLRRLLDRENAWAVHPATLAAIAAAAAGEISADEIDHLEPEALRTRGSSTTGGVAVLSLQGLITPKPSFLSMLFGGGGGLIGFRSALREAVASDEITAIVLDIDSPGGSTDLVAETAAELRAAKAVKPVIAVANTWAASAAYWLAAQADELVVTPSGEIGSVGVFVAHQDVSKLQADLGVKTTLVSAGRFKTEGNQFEPLTDEARSALQAKVDEYYSQFVADVAKGRGATAAAVRGGYGEGRLLTAKQALAAGMADRIDTLEGTVARIVRNPRSAKRATAAEIAERIAAAHDDILQAQIEAMEDVASHTSSGDPSSTRESGEEQARPSESYIDLMFDPSR